MLVLSRHRDESIMIGDDIVVTIVDIRGDKIRLGIDAPAAVPVHRKEVYEALQRDKRKYKLPAEAVADPNAKLAPQPPAPETLPPTSQSLQDLADSCNGDMCDE